jgi:hypothetical protein
MSTEWCDFVGQGTATVREGLLLLLLLKRSSSDDQVSSAQLDTRLTELQ